MKELCKLSKKDIEKDFDKVVEEVRRPCFLCVKCARAAHSRKRLCKPVEFQTETAMSHRSTD